MAKLVSPAIAYRQSGKLKSKWHLRNINTSNPNSVSVCNQLLPDNNQLLPDTDIGWDIKNVKEIPATDICSKCLGSILAI